MPDEETSTNSEATETETAESKEERVTGVAPSEAGLDPNSREYHALHGWPEETEGG